MIRIVHYINQFFAQKGGEEMAHIPAEKVAGKVGPGLALEAGFNGEAEIVATIICGDSYFNENLEKAQKEILEMIKAEKPDLFIAGPAFNAGRYGVACGTIANAVKEELGIPVLTGMYIENPGADMFKNKVLTVPTKNSAAGMKDAVSKMVPLALKLAKGEAIGASCEDNYMPNGIRTNFFEAKRGSARAVDMLLAKLADKPFTTEYPMPSFDRVVPHAAVKDLSKAKVAFVTSGGIVAKGNPDHIESSNASHFGKYSIEGVMDLTPDNSETAHGGYDPVYANDDSDRVVPVDVMREFVADGTVGELHEFYYSTTGNGTAVASAVQFGKDIAADLHAANVDAVILTSTWGTCTRCGATMVKEIERAGFPVVHICTVTPISMTVGANRIVPAIAIPHPLGDPNLTMEEEKAIRRRLLKKAFHALTTEVEDQTIFED